MKNNFIIAFLVFLFLSVLFTAPIFDDNEKWGQKDWDQFVMWNAVPHRTIQEYGQIPLWNPYVNGGNVMLAHPQSAFLSPFFIFVMIFGPYLGLKIQITVHVFLGLWGMFLLAQQYGLRDMSCYWAAFLFMFSAVFPLHLTEGHTEWLCMAFVPWLFYFYLRSIQDIRWVVGGIASLTLIFHNGSVDVFNLFNVFLIVFAVLVSLQQKWWRPVKSLAMIFAGTFLICAVKLFPMLQFLGQNPREKEEVGGLTLRILYHMLLNPDQETLDMMNWLEGYQLGLSYEWHEYGAYVGIIPVVLCLWGCVVFFRKQWPLIVTGMIMLLIAMGNGTLLNVWSILHRLPVYESLTVPSRYIMCFIFFLAIISAMMFERLREKCEDMPNKKRKVLKTVLVLAFLFVPYNLVEMNSSIFWNAFRVDPIQLSEHSLFAQRHREARFYDDYLTNSSIYPIFLSNSGLIEGYEVMQIPQGDLKVMGEPGYRGEHYFDFPSGERELVLFSPNKWVFDIKLDRSNLLILNQNFDEGWRAKANGQQLAVSNTRGLISIVIPDGEYRLEVYYLPQAFLVGAAVSIISLILILAKSWQWFVSPINPSTEEKDKPTLTHV